MGLEQVRLERILDFAKHQLALDAVYLWEFRHGRQECRAAVGDVASFRITPDDAIALQHSYNHRMANGHIPNLIRDSRMEDGVADLDITHEAGIGAYVGAPICGPEGCVWGALAGLSHATRPDLDDSAVGTLALLADLILYDAQEHSERANLRRDIQAFVTAGGFSIAYQPVFDLRTGECLGLEALARFPEPFSRPPDAFAAAERVALGVDLELAVAQRATEILPALPAGKTLALNISPGALLDRERWDRYLGKAPLSRLVVEVTEHASVAAYARLRDELTPMRERGLRIAVDDAGAGYASLRHILELRPDFIKLDRWLIDGLAQDRARRVAVGSFVSLARELGAQVVAEGVERREDLVAIRQLGIDTAQGYLFGHPSTDLQMVERWYTVGWPAAAGGLEIGAGSGDGALPESERNSRPAHAGSDDPVTRSLTADGGVRPVDGTVGRELERLELDRRLSQRLAAVGQLAAGIAHEINTPLQFVGDSVSFLRDAVEELVRVTALYREALHTETSIPLEERRRAMRQAEEDADVDYLCRRIPAAIERTVDGIERVRSIVQAMKRFSHAGGTETAPADINEALRTTLVVCRNEYKYVADVTVDLEPLPDVVCSISELNQVFLNLIVNAAHAIEEQIAQGGERGEITVRTRQSGDSVVIEVADTGPGIPSAVIDRIYDPFFTTKPVGKGTGQGLALALATVNRHDGLIDCASSPGRGTTFTITLPLQTSISPVTAATAR